MIHLEKISTARSDTYTDLQYSFSDAMDHPGLIGIFYNNPKFAVEIKKKCDKNLKIKGCKTIVNYHKNNPIRHFIKAKTLQKVL